MPTITPTHPETDIAAIVAALNYGIEQTERLASDALTEMLECRVAMRDALLPAFNAYYEAEYQAALATNPKRDMTKFTVSAKEVNAHLSGMAGGAKHWKFSIDLINELLYTLDGHDENQVTKYVLWCVDGQGKFDTGPRKGQSRPPVIPSYHGYLNWIPTAKNYDTLGRETPTARKQRLLAAQQRELNNLRQVGTVDYVNEFMPTADLRLRVETLMRQAHDIARALLIIERGLSTDEERDDFRAARRAVSKAIKGN